MIPRRHCQAPQWHPRNHTCFVRLLQDLVLKDEVVQNLTHKLASDIDSPDAAMYPAVIENIVFDVANAKCSEHLAIEASWEEDDEHGNHNIQQDVRAP